MNKAMINVLALFSGGLDSILSAKMMEKQGANVLCLHFVTPFFGTPEKADWWNKVYGLKVLPIDVGGDFVEMLANGPQNGFGKHLNPCIDCKILLLRKAKEMLDILNADFLVTGEVVGQRPMSQRSDAMRRIEKSAGVEGLLLRPLCAQKLPETRVESLGLVDRSKLGGIHGRGRKDQLALAKEYGLTELPTPAGGCLLAEKESAKRYFPVLKFFGLAPPFAAGPWENDFHLANTGRQYWHNHFWLVVGRCEEDNLRLNELAREEDFVFKAAEVPGPTAILRCFRSLNYEKACHAPEQKKILHDALSFTAWLTPKARKFAKVSMQVIYKGLSEEKIFAEVTPSANSLFSGPTWEAASVEKLEIWSRSKKRRVG